MKASMKTYYFQIKDYKTPNLESVTSIQLKQKVRPKVGKIVLIFILIQTLFNKVAAFKAIPMPLVSCFQTFWVTPGH